MFLTPSDYLSLATDEVEAKDEEVGPSNCLCNGPSCICCIDFNMTLIDLGGPGCVRLKYLSADEGIALNVSYGDSVLHSQRVKGPDPPPTCLNVFSSLAQMCARFSELLPTDEGLRGCLQLEPMLLGDVQIELPLGCFRMGPKGMEVIKSAEEQIKEQIPSESEETPSTTLAPVVEEKPAVPAGNSTSAVSLLDNISTADILAAVSESTDEGIAMISNWLGLSVNRVQKPAAAAGGATDAESPTTPEGDSDKKEEEEE
ncbi:AGAP008005-PA-like protein [Anopheles sinensis]|uniref:AGAP008005-PA-like protein n=1 Tax=Anopheles sinensis TaxID=74873 RepID=A0A084WD90_ANOSI|nr:AGAP008005-PA-like protein [Anopheles sinensis]